MNPKSLFSTILIYMILIGLRESTGIIGGIWSIIHFLAAAFIWIGFVSVSLVVIFFPNMKVKQRLRPKVNSNFTVPSVILGAVLGLVIASVWFIPLNSPWTGLAQTAFVIEAFFLKSYMVNKRGSY